MLLMALSATLVVSSLPGGYSSLDVELEIKRQLQLLEDEALISRQIYGVVVYQDGLCFMMLRRDMEHGFRASEWPGYVWVPLQKKNAAYVVPDGMSLVLEIDGRNIPLNPMGNDIDRLPQWLIIPDDRRHDRLLKVSKP